MRTRSLLPAERGLQIACVASERLPKVEDLAATTALDVEANISGDGERKNGEKEGWERGEGDRRGEKHATRATSL